MNSLAYVVYKIVSHVPNENENEKHTNNVQTYKRTNVQNENENEKHTNVQTYKRTNVQTYKRTKWKTGPLNEDQHASQ